MVETVDSESNGGAAFSERVVLRTAKQAKAAIAGLDLWSCRGEEANTLLHDAISEGAFPCVMKVIIEAIGDVNVCNIHGETPLGLAVAGGKTKMAKMLLEAGANANLPDKKGQTALMKAADAGHAEMVSMLIKRGADVNAADHHGQTALMRASSWGDDKAVKALLSSGASCGFPDKDGWTAANYAEAFGHPEIVKMLEKHSGVNARRES